MLTDHDPRKPSRLSNAGCPYCGCTFSSEVPSEKEHVIGRRFVPKGTLDGAWNLILRACRRCNALKADLEDDISAIAMHPDASGTFAHDDARLQKEARRKAAHAISRRTKRPVASGEQPIKISGVMGPAEVNFTLVGPPQASESRLFLLAQLQLQALFYFLTYNEEVRRGSFWADDFQPIRAVRRQDWGNPQLLWFQEFVANWLPRLHVITADGFFKVWIRRKTLDEPLWAWALEWNSNFRLVGFFGLNELAQKCLVEMPNLNFHTLSHTGDRSLRMRIETPLADAADTLFSTHTA